MELSRLIEALAEPAAFPYPVDAVEVRQTHISVVFLAGDYVYKIKKPVDFGFLDFTTLKKRRRVCEEEVRLNRRLAAQVYLGVVPVTLAGGKIRFEGKGEAVEWAVKMVRLPERDSLGELLRRGRLGFEPIQNVARTLAAFHSGAEAGPRIAAFGRFEVVSGNARENFEQAASHVGLTISRSVFQRLRTLTEEALSRLQPTIDQRAAAGVPRDTHGDLRLDHIYFSGKNAASQATIIIDCIEFNERFRFADPVADMAFAYMDFLYRGREDLARSFAAEYFRAAGDPEGRLLLPFYTAYRAAVRGKVAGLELFENGIPARERALALSSARGHWLLALGELEPAGNRPCLILVGGLPGTGKSTLARGLAEKADFVVIRSDEVRKELAQRSGITDWPSPFREGIYSAEWTERTYVECQRRAEALIFEGKRVLIDASFREEKRRRPFLEAARAWGIPGHFLHCQANPESIRARLSARRHDVSDADWAIYLQAAELWEEMKDGSRTHAIVTDNSPDLVVSCTLDLLRQFRLAG